MPTPTAPLAQMLVPEHHFAPAPGRMTHQEQEAIISFLDEHPSQRFWLLVTQANTPSWISRLQVHETHGRYLLVSSKQHVVVSLTVVPEDDGSRHFTVTERPDPPRSPIQTVVEDDDSWQASIPHQLKVELVSLRRRVHRIEVDMLAIKMSRLTEGEGEGDGDEAAASITEALASHDDSDPVAPKIHSTEAPIKRIEPRPLPPIGTKVYDPSAARSKTYHPDSEKEGRSIDLRKAVLRCECEMEYPVAGGRGMTDLHNHCVKVHQRVPTRDERIPKEPA